MIWWIIHSYLSGWLKSSSFLLVAPVTSVDNPLCWAKTHPYEEPAPTNHLIADINDRNNDKSVIPTGELLQITSQIAQQADSASLQVGAIAQQPASIAQQLGPTAQQVGAIAQQPGPTAQQAGPTTQQPASTAQQADFIIVLQQKGCPTGHPS